jgi:hypothetical protein
MANTILLKRSSTPGSVPTVSSGALGELIINTNDGRLYTKINDGTNRIVDLTQNDQITLSGDASGTSINANVGTGYSNLAVTLSSTGVVAGTYGSATSVPTFTVDTKGRITSVTTNTISTSFTLSGTTGSQVVAGGSTLSLAGTYGVTVTVGDTFANISTPQDLQTTASPAFTGLTVNGTNIEANLGTATNNITTLFSNAASQATDLNTLFSNAASQATDLNTLFSNAASQATAISTLDANLGTATTNITTLFSNAATQSSAIATIQTDIGNIVATANANVAAYLSTLALSTDTLTANSVTAGEITISGNSISSTNAIISIDPSTAGIGGTVVIAGNLQVTGTTTTVNSTTVDIADLNLTLAKGAVNAEAANGAGITIDAANATFTYASTGDKWTMNKALDITGGLTTSGNTAINSTLYANEVYDSGNRVLTTATSFSNSSGDATVSGGYNALLLTLATVNSNVGSFGNATHSVSSTVNAKGLVTAISESKITPAFVDITSTPTTLAGYGITDAVSNSDTIDGGTY